MPIPEVDGKTEAKVSNWVDEIIALKQAGKPTKDLEEKIDEEVYKLYDLTTEEIALIKSSIK